MATPAQPQPVSSGPDQVEFPSTGEIDASCRGPVCFLLFNATAWLVLGSILAVIASIQLHGQFLSNVPWLTYGRVRPATTNIFLYGFASQAGLGLMLWMLCRLGRTMLLGPVVTAIAGAFWNLAVVFGVVSILGGNSTSYEWLEMPRPSLVVMLAAYLVIAIAALRTFAARNERELYVSQWFLLAALFIFPWISSTAVLLLHVFPVRGVMQAVVDYWYINNFLQLWLGGIALAVIFYFVPKVSGKPLYSRGLAAVAFWILLLVAGWGGIPTGARLPAWMPSVSVVANSLLLIPAVAFALSWRTTLKERSKGSAGSAFCFITVAGIAYVAFVALAAIGSFPGVARIVEFTHFNFAVSQLALYGFFAMAVFGAVYFVVPQLTATEWLAGRIKTHFMCSIIGLLLIVVPLLVAGFVQGTYWQSPDAEFVASVRKTIPFVGVSTIGFVVLLIGHVVFFSNVVSVMKRCCCSCIQKGRTK
jgi:cytochrome c oxidase cbb3-type subunit 1